MRKTNSYLGGLGKKISHICFADDDEDDHIIFSSALAEVDQSIVLSLFLHCDELIDYLNDEKAPLPDIIFLDYNMPGNDGYECLKILKKTARVLHIPVIIYSTSNSETGIKLSYNSGAHRYIIKPDSIQLVKEKIKEVITGLE